MCRGNRDVGNVLRCFVVVDTNSCDASVLSDLTEPPDGQLYYTEQLVRLKGCM